MLIKPIISIVSITLFFTGCQSQPAKTSTPLEIKIEHPISKMETQLTRITKLRKKVAEAGNSKSKNITPANFEKTTGIILRLLERAEQTLTDTLPKARFDWERQGYTSPEKMIDQAEGYLNILKEGKDPLHGKFAEPGGTVIDHCLIKKDGLFHLFYIRGKAATHWPESPTRNFGHATSKDLLNWETHEPVIQSPEKGWDEYQVWAPHIVKHNGEYYMLYTGVSYPCCQCIGLAKSKDLFNWKRIGDGPVITPGEWGIWRSDGGADCRDPSMLKVGDTYYCYYTAVRKVEGADPPHEFCVGISSSKDLINWKDEGFARLETSLKTPPESPFAVEKDGKFYLFYTSYKYGTVVAVSDHPAKGWKDLPEDKLVTMAGISASEVLKDGDDWYISLISHAQNALHFFEIRKLIWHDDGKITVEVID